MAQMLVGIKVVDLSRLLPGPFCTQLLADLGAEVIKVEVPGEGDPSRGLRTAINGYGSTFLMLNRSKKSITLNLKAKEGVEVFRRLAGRADVVVESFRPGVMERLGIDYQRIKRDNRKLIYCSLTGWGQSGPYARRPGHDINYLAVAGLAGITGARGGKPVPPGVQVADIAGGSLMAAFGIMAALYHRERTGRGQYLDVAMLDGLIAVGQTLLGEHLAGANPAGPGTMRLNGGYPVYGIYETKDKKHLTLGNLEKKFFDAFCNKAGRPDLKEFHYSGFDKNRDRLEKELTKLVKTRTRDEWVELLSDADTCAAPALELGEMMEDPQVRHRKLIVTGPHPEGGELQQAGFPIKFSEAEPEPPRTAPKLGEHTEEVLLAVGYTKKELELFREKGVI